MIGTSVSRMFQTVYGIYYDHIFECKFSICSQVKEESTDILDWFRDIFPNLMI